MRLSENKDTVSCIDNWALTAVESQFKQSIISDNNLTMLFNAEPLKEPRGFLRLIQWFIAMLAFATCCDFSTQFGFRITCKNYTDPTTNDTTPKGPFNFSITATYPFR